MEQGPFLGRKPLHVRVSLGRGHPSPLSFWNKEQGRRLS